MTHLDEIHREEILERARRKRELASRQPPAVVESAAPEDRATPKLLINDSASKARARGAEKQQGRFLATRTAKDLIFRPVRDTRAAKPPVVPGHREELARRRMILNHQDPDFEAKRIAAIRASWTPERKAAAGKKLNAARKNPEVEARRIASLKEAVKTRRARYFSQEERSSAAVRAKARLADSQFKAKFTAAGQRNLAAYNQRRKAAA